MFSSSNKDKSRQEKLCEEWKASAPFRRNDCIDIINQLRDLSNKNFGIDEKLSQAINIIYNKLNLYYLLVFCAEDGYVVLRAGAGIHIEGMLRRKEKRKIGTVGFVGQVALTKKLLRYWDTTPDELPQFSGADFPNTMSAIAFPLLINQEVIGVMELGSTIRCDFRVVEDSELQLLVDCVAGILAKKE